MILEKVRLSTVTPTMDCPKPISAPSKSSLIAAANPTQSEYLYFVSKGKCAHQFSKSYPEHMEAIKNINSTNNVYYF